MPDSALGLAVGWCFADTGDMRAAVFSILALVVGLERADASCVEPTFNGLEWGVVPTRGVFYVYDTSRVGPSVQWHGGEGTASLTRLSDPNITRIDFEGAEGSRIVINGIGYPLRSSWRAPTKPPAVTSYGHYEDAATCWFADELLVEIDQPTAAIRAKWSYRGTSAEWVVPAPKSETTSKLALGKMGCGGITLPPDQLAAGGHLELFAIRVDGSEVRVEGLPDTIATSRMNQLGLSQAQRERADSLDDVHELLLSCGLLLLLWLPRITITFACTERTSARLR